jgi:hypothetical protein
MPRNRTGTGDDDPTIIEPIVSADAAGALPPVLEAGPSPSFRPGEPLYLDRRCGKHGDCPVIIARSAEPCPLPVNESVWYAIMIPGVANAKAQTLPMRLARALYVFPLPHPKTPHP